MEKDKKVSIVEEEMKKLDEQSLENHQNEDRATGTHSEKMRFKYADKIYE